MLLVFPLSLERIDYHCAAMMVTRGSLAVEGALRSAMEFTSNWIAPEVFYLGLPS